LKGIEVLECDNRYGDQEVETKKITLELKTNVIVKSNQKKTLSRSL
jgi:hypothetical protein